MALLPAILLASSRAVRQQVGGRHHRLECSEPVGLCGGDRLAGVQHAADVLDREHPIEMGRRAEGAAIDLGKSEGRVFRSEDDVGRSDDADAATEDEAVCRGDDRNRTVVDCGKGLVAAVVHRGDHTAVFGELFDVDAGAEAASLGVDQDHVGVVAHADPGDFCGEADPAGAVEGVDRGVVEKNLGNSVFDGCMKGHCGASSSVTPSPATSR